MTTPFVFALATPALAAGQFYVAQIRSPTEPRWGRSAAEPIRAQPRPSRPSKASTSVTG